MNHSWYKIILIHFLYASNWFKNIHMTQFQSVGYGRNMPRTFRRDTLLINIKTWKENAFHVSIWAAQYKVSYIGPMANSQLQKEKRG